MQKYKKFLGLFLMILFVFNCANFLFAGRRSIKRAPRKKIGKRGTSKKGVQKKKKIARRREERKSSVVKASELGEDLLAVIKDREKDDDQCFDEVVEFLQDYGDELSRQDLDLSLGWAVNEGRVNVVRLLLKNGANVNSDNINEAGRTPLLVASMMYEELGQETCLGLIKILVAHGADVNRQCNGGSTALHDLAVESEIMGCLFLLKNGAKVDLADKYGEFSYDDIDDVSLKNLLRKQYLCEKYWVYRKFMSRSVGKLTTKLSNRK